MTSFAGRMLVPFTPRATPSDPAELAGLQWNRQRSATVWLVAGVAGAHLVGLQWPAVAYGLSGWVWIALIALVAGAMLAAGFGQLVLLARAEQRRIPAATSIGALAGLGLLVSPVSGLLWMMFGMVHLALPVGAMALGIALLAFEPSMRAAAPRPVAGTLLGAGTAALIVGAGVLDSLVLLPMALAPGVPLAELYAQLSAAREDGGLWLPLAWAGLWLVGIVLLALGLLRNRRSQRGAAGTLLAAGVAAVFALPIAQFSIGMGVADTLATRGGMSMAFPAIALVATLLAALASALLIGAGRR